MPNILTDVCRVTALAKSNEAEFPIYLRATGRAAAM
jgi:hypothetical protein